MAATPQSAEHLMTVRLAEFTATLRAAGYGVSIGKTEDAARLLASPLARRPSTLRPAFRALFAGNHAEWQGFDALFDAAFLGIHVRKAVRTNATTPKPGPRTLREIQQSRTAMQAGSAETGSPPDDGGDDTSDQAGVAMRGGASSTEGRAGREMRDFGDADALAEAEAAAAQIAARLAARRTRRYEPARHGGRLDLRRTIRASLAHGGAPVDLALRRKRRRKLRIALLIDVSGSIGLHIPLFVRFALGMLRSTARADAFLMHTRLVGVSNAMREPDRFRALDRLTLLSKGVGGGTRLGESLATFNRHHAKHALAGRSVCLILSDGYETGDIALFEREMAALRRRCRRIVWLNPLASASGYTPAARGMKAALPHLRLFAPFGGIDDLHALERRLAHL